MKDKEEKPERKDLGELLKLIPQQPQRKMKLNNQLKALIHFSNQLGMFDASEYLKRVTK